MRDVWCTMPEMSRLDVKYCQSVVVRCGMYRSVAIASRTSSHHYHYILHCIFPHQTPSLTLFQATHSTSHHHRFSPYRTFHIGTSRSTLFNFAIPYIYIGLKSHPIGHIMHHTTSSGTAPHHSFHIPVPQCHIPTMYSTPHFRSHHISRRTTSHAHSLHQSTTVGLTVISHIHRHTTSHTTPCHGPHSTSFHITQRLHSGHSTAHVPIHITPPLSITPFQFQRLGTMMSDPLLFHSYIQPFVPHIEPKQKWWWRSATLFRQKVPVCPNTILFRGSFLKLNPNITDKLNGWSEPAVLGENDRCFSSSSFFSSRTVAGCVGLTCFT